MRYPAIMVFVEAEDASEQRVRLAASIAEKFNATLIGVSALALPQVLDKEIKEFQTILSQREAWFSKFIGPLHLELEWRAAIDFPTDVLLNEARAADLVVIGRSKPSEDLHRRVDLARAVLDAGRPVLVVPDGIGTLRARHVVIGWKDRREARRAVTDALPFLREADTVAIVEIYDADGSEAAQKRITDVAQFLERHKVSVGPKISVRHAASNSDAAQLIRIAQDAGGDLLVTGAYGHSRLGERLFGGVTRELLASSPICCLMSN